MLSPSGRYTQKEITLGAFFLLVAVVPLHCLTFGLKRHSCRILTSLASGPAWLTEALQQGDGVSELLSALSKTDLSWYNT